MQNTTSSRFEKVHPLLYRLLILCAVTVSVYLFFRYLLALILPFILSYLFMRMLFPITRLLRRRFRFPSWLAHTTTLGLFFGIIIVGFWFLFRQLWQQLQLLLTNFPVYRQIFSQMYANQTRRLCRCIDSLLCIESGTSAVFFQNQVDTIQSNCRQLLSDNAGTWLASCFSGSVHLFTILVIIVICMVLLCKDMGTIHMAYHKSPYYYTLHTVAITLKKTGLSYLKSQGIIMLTVWFLCSSGLMIIGNPYGILLGLCIAIMDAFPVLGSGIILAPWAIYEMFQGRYFAAAVLLTVLILTIVTRELLEAKLMGNNMGLLPFFMTASIYIGVCLFGVWGIFLGPFGVILIRTIYSLLVR